MEKIVFAAKKYLNPSETFIYEPLKHISSFEVIVLAEEKANLDRFPHPRVFSISDLPPRQCFFENVFSQLGRFRYFKEIIEKYKPKLIHAHFSWEGHYMLPLKKYYNLPLITSFYGSDINVYPRSRIARWQLNRLFAEGDLFLAVCKDLKEKAISLGCPKNKIIVHDVGTEINKFRPGNKTERKDDQVKILMCGRLVEYKGFTYGIEAFAHCFNKHKNIRLQIIGDGPLKNGLFKQIKKLGLERYVTILGNKSHPEVAQAMQEADIFMMPYTIGKHGECEGLPNVLKEAQAAGLPVISTSIGGIPEVVKDGESGFLVKEKNISALIQKLKILIEDPSLCSRFGKNGRKIIEERFGLDSQVCKLENIYRKLMNAYEEKSY
jgi:colanic acid/amylovoran biosynthesis glycosyltransferase